MNHPVLVKMSGITKRFPGVIANNQVNIEIKAGEIHGPAGWKTAPEKATLMSVLTGLYRPDSGEILVKR